MLVIIQVHSKMHGSYNIKFKNQYIYCRTSKPLYMNTPISSYKNGMTPLLL
jgi:hypothetical protein